MGCAVSNTRTLCKAIGVENDKPGVGGMMRNMGRHHQQNGADASDKNNGISTIGQKISEENGGGGFTQRMASFENDMVQKGKNTFEGITDKGKDTMNNAMENLEGFGKSVEENVKSGAQDMAKTGMMAVEDLTHQMEEEVKVVSENVKSKIGDATDKVGEVKDKVTTEVKDKVGDIFDLGDDATSKLKKSESKEDIGDKIDEILALSIDEVEMEQPR